MREAFSLMGKCSAAAPKQTGFSRKLAEFHAWFGDDEGLAVTRRRILANAERTDLTATAERASKVCSVLPPADKVELDASIVLARRVLDLKQPDMIPGFAQMTLGMAEYLVGQLAKAESTLAAARDEKKGHPEIRDTWFYYVVGTSSYYRAMRLFRQGKEDEARKLATEAWAKMKPLPADELNPTADGATFDDLILLVAYKESKDLIGFDPPPAAPAKPDGMIAPPGHSPRSASCSPPGERTSGGWLATSPGGNSGQPAITPCRSTATAPVMIQPAIPRNGDRCRRKRQPPPGFTLRSGTPMNAQESHPTFSHLERL